MSRRAAVAAVVLGAAAIALLAALGTPARTYRDFDFIPFWVAGRLVLSGGDPYDADTFRRALLEAGSQGYAFGGGFAYPLPAAILALPFAALPFAVAAPGWLVAQTAVASAALIALARRLFVTDFPRDTAVLLALAVSIPGTFVSAYTGQVSGFLVAIAAGALALLLAGRPMLAGAVLGLGIAKPQVFLLLVPLLLLASRERARIAVGGFAVTVLLLLPSFAVRPGWLAEWLGAATAVAAVDVAHANVWGLFPSDAAWAGWIVLVLAVAAFAAWSSRAQPPFFAYYGAAVALSLAATPYGWSYYDTVLAVPAAAAIAAVPTPTLRRLTTLVALAAVTVVMPWVFYLATYRTGEDPLGAVPPLASLLIVIALTRRPVERLRMPASAATPGSRE